MYLFILAYILVDDIDHLKLIGYLGGCGGFTYNQLLIDLFGLLLSLLGLLF